MKSASWAQEVLLWGCSQPWQGDGEVSKALWACKGWCCACSTSGCFPGSCQCLCQQCSACGHLPSVREQGWKAKAPGKELHSQTGREAPLPLPVLSRCKGHCQPAPWSLFLPAVGFLVQGKHPNYLAKFIKLVAVSAS